MPHEERDDLHRARAAAHECVRAATQLVEFADRMTVVIGPSEVAEYHVLVAREAAALSQRADAFERLGLGPGSVDATE